MLTISLNGTHKIACPYFLRSAKRHAQALGHAQAPVPETTLRYRENVMLLVVFLSLPLLFMVGISWPQSAIPGVWQGVSWLFPSTFGARAYVRLNTMGASLSDVLPELRYLWIQAAFYFGTACLVYGHQLRESRRHAAAAVEAD